MLVEDNFVRKVIEVPHYVDGDTIDVVLDLGFDPVTVKKRLRFANIDTPEEGDEGFDEAAKFVHDHLSNAVEITIRTKNWEQGSFGRWVAVIFVNDGEKQYNLNYVLLEKHLAVPYFDK